uniref:hypothetical protein n=1 Tax=Coprococcus catus TaxID=116085 RepID=UPI0022E4607B|nr:hypothetical protein [Coprococcus catus]
MKNRLKNLNNIESVKFCDYTSYDPNKCHDGGSYAFYKNYKRDDNGMWYAVYSTTADFDYCPCCGIFSDHYDEDYESGYSCGEFETVTDEELLDIINSFEETEDEYIEFRYKEGSVK